MGCGVAQGQQPPPGAAALAMASRAAKRVWRPLTSSLLSQGRRCCKVAPMTLSARVASNLTRVTKAQAWGVAIKPRAAISAAMAWLTARSRVKASDKDLGRISSSVCGLKCRTVYSQSNDQKLGDKVHLPV